MLVFFCAGGEQMQNNSNSILAEVDLYLFGMLKKWHFFPFPPKLCYSQAADGMRCGFYFGCTILNYGFMLFVAVAMQGFK